MSVNKKKADRKIPIFFFISIVNIFVFIGGWFLKSNLKNANSNEVIKVYADSQVEKYEGSSGQTKIYLRIKPAKEKDAKPQKENYFFEKKPFFKNPTNFFEELLNKLRW